MFFGEVQRDAVYMLCSDGFRHEITPEEIGEGLQPEKLLDEHKMQCCATELVGKNKMRGERDNISVALVRTF